MSFTINNDGFTKLEGVVDPQVLPDLRDFIDRIVANYDVNKDPFNGYYLQHRLDNGVLYDVYQRYPIFRQIVNSPAILKAVETYFKKGSYLYVNSLLYKPSGKQNDVPWHQDFMSRPNESEKLIVWIALDDASERNGCLKVIPESHKNGFYEWETVEGATHHDQLKLDQIDLNTALSVPMKAGDALVFSNYLVHSSEQNNSNLPRRALRVVFKEINDLKIPRGAPIVMTGGNPESYNKKILSDLDDEPPKKINLTSKIRRLLSKVL